jgi:hypothetical protein
MSCVVLPFTLSRRRRRPKHARCEHQHLVIDEESRTLSCEDCGGLVDPLQHLLDMGERKRVWYSHQAKQARPERVNELLADKSNTVARRHALERYLAGLEGRIVIKDDRDGCF